MAGGKRAYKIQVNMGEASRRKKHKRGFGIRSPGNGDRHVPRDPRPWTTQATGGWRDTEDMPQSKEEAPRDGEERILE